MIIYKILNLIKVVKIPLMIFFIRLSHNKIKLYMPCRWKLPNLCQNRGKFLKNFRHSVKKTEFCKTFSDFFTVAFERCYSLTTFCRIGHQFHLWRFTFFESSAAEQCRPHLIRNFRKTWWLAGNLLLAATVIIAWEIICLTFII